MFKLLKSEFKYHKIYLITLLTLIFVINILLTIYGVWAKFLIENKDSNFIWGMFVVYCVIFALSGMRITKMNKKQILQVQKTLPLSNFQISAVRLFYTILIWIFILVLLTVFYKLNTNNMFDFVWLKIIGFMSIIYFWYLSLFLHSNDFSRLKFDKKGKFLITVYRLLVYLFFLLVNYLLVAKIKFSLISSPNVIKQIVHQYLLSTKGIELNLVIGVVLIVSTIFTFNKRKSFL